MESASKRSLGSDQSVGRLSVCSKCTRLSNNPQVCDSCGHSLSEDNAAAVYTSDPKRPRTVPQEPPLLNGNNSHRFSAASSAPQTQVQTAPGSVRPQALYVNLNNQAYPVIGVGDGSARMPHTQNDLTPMPTLMGPTSAAMATPHMMGNMHPGIMSNSLLASMQQQQQAMQQTSLMTMPPNGQPRPPPPLTSMQPQQSSQVPLPGFNLQPPSYLPANSARSSSRPTPAPQASTSSSSSSASSIQEAGTATLTNVPAYQIRIGSRKFIPVSTVQFKEDGVLFTLRNFTFAPVLLNARAIIRCRANLKNALFPVIMLYLEGSCMRQIRSIFELSEREFSESSPVDLRRCITIFPQLEPDNKCSVTRMIKGIAQSFDRMVQKYPRSNAILDLISNNEAIDLITGSCIDEDEPTPTAPMSSAPAPAPAHPPPNMAPSMLAPNIALAPRYSGSQVTASTANNSHGPPTPRGAAPMLRMPSDDGIWQQMQKNLVTGGVYHVLTPDGQRKYCLWSGKQLVPCHVQNMEVQLKTVHACIGNLKITEPVTVKIKTDTPSGIYFSCKIWRQSKALYIPVEEMMHCKKSIVDGFCALFIRPSEQIVAQFNLYLGTKDSSKWFIAMILEDLSSEQREALVQMKRPGQNGRPIFDSLAVPNAFQLYAELSDNKRVLSAVNRLIRDGSLVTDSFVAKMSAALLEKDSSSANAVAAAAADDDDDVVMTSEEIGVKCPYTQAVMKQPIRNKICGHNYEKMAIHEFILRKKGNAKCPYAGCGNIKPLSLEDMEDNRELKDYIEKMKTS